MFGQRDLVGAPRRNQSRTSSGWNLLPLTPKRCERSNPAPVRATDGLFVAADERGDLEGGEQAAGQAVPYFVLSGGQMIVDPNTVRVDVRMLRHVVPP